MAPERSGTLDSRLARLQTLGTGVVRFTLHWDQIAATEPTSATDPTDPAYDWTADDEVLDALHAHGFDVLLQLVGTPSWANGGLAANYAPTSPTTFGEFASAAANRYPWVHRWLIWNEPNQVRWLRPTTAAVYTARLLNPAYAAIHSAIRGAQVARRRHGAARLVGRRLTRRLAARHAQGTREARRLRAQPIPAGPEAETPLTGGCTRCTTITMATISKLVALVGRNSRGHASG